MFLATQASTQSITSLVMIGLMIVVFYFLLIRPQQKKAKQVQQMLSALKVGDRVRTIGGLHGRIIEIMDEKGIVVIEVGYDNKVKMAFERSAVAQVNDEGTSADPIDGK